jgi:PhnB protein
MSNIPNHIVQPYLFFNGKCEEAVGFYKQAIGAQVLMQMRFKESPEPPAPGRLPEGYENKIMHCTMQVGASVVMASDGNSAEPANFDGFSLSLTVPTEADAHKAYTALLQGGKVLMPIGKTFWSACFGSVQDKFGVSWMVSVPPSM